MFYLIQSMAIYQYKFSLKNIINFSLCLLLPLSIGALAGIITKENIPTWYTTTQKPIFNPPNFVFAPVWTTLYLLLGISLYLVLQQLNNTEKIKVSIFFGIQMLFNFLWSILFFEMHWIGIAFIEILLLWISIFLMILYFYKLNKIASYINIPYLLWVSFASFLNYNIYLLNS